MPKGACKTGKNGEPMRYLLSLAYVLLFPFTGNSSGAGTSSAMQILTLLSLCLYILCAVHLWLVAVWAVFFYFRHKDAIKGSSGKNPGGS